MAITLPYEFDTTRVSKLIMTGVLGLEIIVIIPGIIYSLVITGNKLGALLLFVTGCIFLFFGFRIFNFLEGSVGTITAQDVVVKRGEVLGLRIPGPTGRFSIQQFRSVRVDMSSGPVDPGVRGGPNERIYLVGKDGTPDILVARTDRSDADRGIDAGQQFGRLLNLPCEQREVLR